MAYTPIPTGSIRVGDPITKELWDLLRSNFEDHEERLTVLGGGSGKISLFNTDIKIGSNASGILTGVLYYEVLQSCIITEGAIRLFTKSPATTGSLTVDIKKNTSTNPSGFNSIFSVAPTISMAAADYSRNAGTINPAMQTLNVGDILRVDITALPAGLQRFMLLLIGEF